MRRNPSVDAVTKELKQAGIPYTIETGIHVKIRFLDKMIVTSKTTGDQLAVKNARSVARRLIREHQKR